MATVNTPISLSGYIEHIQKYGTPSPATIETYKQARDAIGIDEIKTSAEDLSNIWRHLYEGLDNKTIKRGFIKNALILIKATLNLYAVPIPDDYNYNLLLAKLRKTKPELKLAYTDNDVQTILGILKAKSDPQAFNACLLMAATACRIGSTKNVRFDQFEQVPEVLGVRVWVAVGKGRTYQCAISDYAYEILKIYARGDPFVVRYDETLSTKYEDLVRKKVLNAINKENDLVITAGKSVLHSFRKWGIGKMAMSGLRPDEVRQLAGHNAEAYNSITQRHYVNANRYSDNMKKYIAELYSKTDLFTWRLN